MLGELSVMEFLYLATTIIGLPVVAFLVVRRLRPGVDGRSTEMAGTSELAERLLRIETRLEDLADENRRLAEANRFMTTLLSERASGTLG
jgi:hypothetical protein